MLENDDSATANRGHLQIIEVEWPKQFQLTDGKLRRIWVWLPPGYANSLQDYAVLFMHDGQNVFRDEDATFGTSWQMIDAQLQLQEPMIVVGVEGQNNGQRRFDEFSPWKNTDLGRWKSSPGMVAGGDADHYLEFLVTTIVPMVHQAFRCKTEPLSNTLGGSSMGGFVSLYASTKYESVFGKYMAMSTATWFAQEPLLNCLSVHTYQYSTQIYADIGTNETSNDQIPDFPAVYLDGNKALFNQLRVSLAEPRFLSLVSEGDTHNEAAWAQRLPAALRWLKLE